MAPSSIDVVPSRLGPYEIRAKIADGGMATVYLGVRPDAGAEDSDVNAERPKLAALKVIRTDFSTSSEFADMFRDEATLALRLCHPNVVRLYELGKEGSRLYIAMELLMGQSLWNVWEACRERSVRLRYDVLAHIGSRAALGLHHAHELRGPGGEEENVVHRDVNASNILLTYDGHIKIIDFGLAKAKNRVSSTAAGIVKGKLAYMSPEQTVGRAIDRRTDVFALATTLWELSVDRRLFKGKDDVETLKAVHAARVPDPTKLVAGFPPRLWGVLKRAFERDPEKRTPTALTLSKELEEFANEYAAGEAREGVPLGPEGVARVMRVLFDAERERQAVWLADALADVPRVRLSTLRPQAGDHEASPDAHDSAAAATPRSGVPRETLPPPPSAAFDASEALRACFIPGAVSLPDTVAPELAAPAPAESDPSGATLPAHRGGSALPAVVDAGIPKSVWLAAGVIVAAIVAIGLVIFGR